MRKILSLVMALAMLCGMCSFASADEVVTLEWYVLEGPAPGNEMVWAAINDYMVEKIGVKINFHYITSDEYTSKMQPLVMSPDADIDIDDAARITKLYDRGYRMGDTIFLRAVVDADDTAPNAE